MSSKFQATQHTNPRKRILCLHHRLTKKQYWCAQRHRETMTTRSCLRCDNLVLQSTKVWVSKKTNKQSSDVYSKNLHKRLARGFTSTQWSKCTQSQQVLICSPTEQKPRCAHTFASASESFRSRSSPWVSSAVNLEFCHSKSCNDNMKTLKIITRTWLYVSGFRYNNSNLVVWYRMVRLT